MISDLSDREPGAARKDRTLAAVRLSICIPTYNFGRFIGETLSSILPQIAEGVEVVVLDSDSTDNTPLVMADWQLRCPWIRYERAAEKRGIDRDMARVVELAQGEYCWLLSADDLVAAGAIDRALAEIRSGKDLYICVHSNETIDMRVIRPRHPVLRLGADACFDLSDPRDQLRYFSLAVTTEAFFSFMSGLIVKRAAWSSVPLDEDFAGSCWAHVARLFALMPRGLRVKFLSTAMVRRRGDNDSFTTSGIVQRYALAIDGYVALAERFWGSESRQAFHIRRVLRNEFSLRVFWEGKAECAANATTEDIHLLDRLMATAYRDATLVCAIKRGLYRLLPVWLYRPTRAIYMARPRFLKKHQA